MGLNIGVAVVVLGSVTSPACSYNAEGRIESARLYGDVGSFAYYFVDLLIGTPKPQRASVIVDTGSSICAFPCSGCRHCGKHLDGLFDVSKSKSARWVGCGSANSCSRCYHGRCSYSQSYTEGSSISGSWVDDYVSLGDELQQNPPVRARVGCHSSETRLFYTQKANGIFGMAPSGAGKATILDDLFRDRRHINSAIFAMCIAEHGGLLTVGGYNQTLHRPGASVLWIPMTLRGAYHIRLKGIALAGGSSLRSQFGGTIVDSGTTYTYFPTGLYRELRQAVSTSCDSRRSCRPIASGSKCWSIHKREYLDDFPLLRLSFHGGGEMIWRPQSYMYQKGGRGSLWCYGFEDNGPQHETVLGATWMLNQDVIFDLTSKRLGLAEAACPEFQKRPDPPSGAMSQVGVDGGYSASGGRPVTPFTLPGSPALFGMVIACLAATGLLKLAHNLKVAADRARKLWSAEVEAAAASRLPRRSRLSPKSNALGLSQAAGADADDAAASKGGRGRSEKKQVPLHTWLRPHRGNRDDSADSSHSNGGGASHSSWGGGSSEIEVALPSPERKQGASAGVASNQRRDIVPRT